MKLSILTIGDEILIGQIVDTNSNWLAQESNKMGLEVGQMITVSDEDKSIKTALDYLFQHSDIVITTGGLGPTKDDITKKTLSEYFDMDLVFHEPTWERIQAYFEHIKRPTNEAHKAQCVMPEHAELLINKMGTAPGMVFNKDGKMCISLPGVPYEMKYIMETHGFSLIKERFQLGHIIHKTILCMGAGESVIANRIQSIIDEMPDKIKVAYLPSIARVRIRLSAYQDQLDLGLEKELDHWTKKISDELGHLVFGYGSLDIAEVFGNLLKEKNLKLTLAESCTGGQIASKIVSIPGSSAYFEASIVAYSYEMKNALLEVKKETLEEYGAVSEETVKEMAIQAKKILSSDVSIAVSGIAGPGGGTPDKPVGTVWMAVAYKNECHTEKLQLGKNRLLNIEYTSVRAINMARLVILEANSNVKTI